MSKKLGRPKIAPERWEGMTRLPTPLRKQIEKAAKESGRSANAEITHRLERSFAPEYRRY